MDDQNNQTVSVDGVEYLIASLSDDAKQQIRNIRFVDQEIERLKNLTAVTAAARKTYVDALNQALPKKG